MPQTAPVLPGLPATDGPFVIAEAGVNHNGNIDMALRLVDAAVAGGANAVKFQTFVPELVAAPEAPRAEYQMRSDEGDTQLEMIRELAIDHAGFKTIARHCISSGILFLSTPFDRSSADFLVELGIPCIKVPSGEVTNLPFLRHLAKSGKPLIISTGMANLGEVEQAIATVEAAGCKDYAILHCTSNYPADPAMANLRAMTTLRQAFQCPVGYSDHTLGITVALAAAALGACIIEKHITLDKTLPGPDHRASLDPQELLSLTVSLREVHAALGSGTKRPVASEKPVADIARRSLAAARDLPAGRALEEIDFVELRPGTGIAPADLRQLIGRHLRAPLRKHALLKWTDIE